MELLRKINFNLEFIRPGIRYKILKLICYISGQKNKSFVVDFNGYKYPGVLSNHLDFLVYFFGSYERGILNFLSNKILKKDMIVMDVGANIGHHSLFFSSICNQVYSFEPYGKVRNLFNSKIELNHISNIEVVPFGLSNVHQVLEYFEPDDSNPGTGSFLKGYFLNNKSVGLKLELIKGDEWVNKQNIQKIDFLKVDVEGFEQFVLEGLKFTLEKNRPIIFMEFNLETKNYCKTESTFRDLLPKDYEIFEFSDVFKLTAKLVDFNFSSKHSANLLLLPKEKMFLIKSNSIV